MTSSPVPRTAVLLLVLLGGCSMPHLSSKVVVEKYVGNGWVMSALVAKDRSVCLVDDRAVALSAKAGDRFICDWRKP